METNNTSKLIKNLLRKGISFDRGEKDLFTKYDYYQVINAYKNLFIVDVENIDTIKRNVLNNIDIDRINELYHKSKSVGLTKAEEAEQKKLRKAYLAAIRKNLRGSLNRIDIQNKDGSIENLGEKYGKKLDKN